MKKILITLGPQSLNRKTIRQIDTCGIYLFRLNMSHTAIENLEESIRYIQSSTDTPICIDSEGAQIRSGYINNGGTFLEKDHIIKIHHQAIEGDSQNIYFTPFGISKQFQKGDRINIDFDLAAVRVIECKSRYCLAVVEKSGRVGSNKAADINRHIELKAITDKDVAAFEIGLKMGVQHFALSFASTDDDINRVREIVGPEATVISKIESQMGLANLKQILKSSDEILIDRGDLSRQMPIEKIPFLQRRIISMARIFDTPVFVATNLLENMIKSRTPTRAEVNDVVSTILMGADGLVLAAETAIGKYPVESAKLVREITNLCRKWTPNTTILEIMEM